MRKGFYRSLGAALTLVMLFCTETSDTEYGTLLVTVHWQQGSAPKALAVDSLPDSVVAVEFLLMPDSVTARFDYFDSTYVLHAQLGIFNVYAAALNGSGDTLYYWDTTEVLVQPYETTSVAATLMPRFPWQRPAFVGMDSTTLSTDGSYVISWTSDPMALEYVLETDSDSAFGSPTQLYRGADTTFAVSGAGDGTYYYRVRALNALGGSGWSALAEVLVQVATQLRFVTTALTGGTTTIPYGDTVCATDGTPPYHWEIVSGSLPRGLDTAASGSCLRLSGTPDSAGTFAFTLRVSDNGVPAQDTSRAFTVIIAAYGQPVSIVTDSLETGTLDSAYAASVCAAGGRPPYRWTITTGALPPGVDTATAGCFTLSGTPTFADTYDIAVHVADSDTPSADTASQQLRLVVRALPVAITAPPAMPVCTVGVAYQSRVTAAGGSRHYLWSIVSGSLPSGLSLVPDSTGASIAGTAVDTGSYSARVRVADSVYTYLADSADIVFTVVSLPPVQVATVSPLPLCTLGVPYAVQLAATGGSGRYRWSAVVDSLPPGLALNTDTAGASVRGTPTDTGAHSVTVAVQDTVFTFLADTARLAITSVPVQPLTFTPASLPQASVNVPYDTAVCPVSGTAPFAWTLTDTLPTGLDTSTSGGCLRISGTPTAVDTVTFTVGASDAGTPQRTGSRAYTIIVGPRPLQVTTLSLPACTVDAYYDERIYTSGGTDNLAWLLNGTLAPGVAFLPNFDVGVAGLRGTPTDTGVYLCTLVVRDTLYGLADTAYYSITSLPSTRLRITSDSLLPENPEGETYDTCLCATGGTPPYDWSLDGPGALPQGIDFDFRYTDNLCVGLTGMGIMQGTWDFSIRVVDSGTPQDTAVKAFSITVGPPLVRFITTSPLPEADMGYPYTGQIFQQGGTVGNVVMEVISGTVPPGLAFVEVDDDVFAFQGTPTDTGTYVLRVVARDTTHANRSDTTDFTLHVKLVTPLSISPAALPATVMDFPYDVYFTGAGGSGLWMWDTAAGTTVPLGMDFYPDAGGGQARLYGSAGDIGTFTIRLVLRDITYGLADTVDYQLTIYDARGISMLPTRLPPCTVSVACDTALHVTGGTAPYSWEILSGTLPAGVDTTWGDSSLRFTGTPTAADTSTFTVLVHDADAVPQGAQRTYGVRTSQLLPVTITTTTSPLPDGSMSGYYDQRLACTGGTGNYTWTLESGSLPPGLSLWEVGEEGQVAGTPSGTGTFVFTVRVTDDWYPALTDTQQYSVTINP